MLTAQEPSKLSLERHQGLKQPVLRRVWICRRIEGDLLRTKVYMGVIYRQTHNLPKSASNRSDWASSQDRNGSIPVEI